MPRVLFSARTCHMLRIPLLLMLGLALLSIAAYGQETASIIGTVTDQTGAAVPGAQITITNMETGFIRSSTSNSTGSYAAPQLPIGHYKVRVEAAGFKAYEQTSVTLEVNATVRVDVPLQIGNVKESITVEANAVQVQSDTNEVSQTVTGTQVADLATNGGNVIQLTALVPGASASIPDFDSPMAQNQNRSVYFNGQRQDHNNWIIDGGEAYDRGGGGIMIVSPSQDSLQEFKVITSNYAADLGQSSGGMITMSLKSGTQQYHGGVWEFLRNTDLDANYFFLNAGNVPRANLHYNLFGFNLGGPVPLTRRKTFFFYNMEWRRLAQGSPFNTSAVSSAVRGGDFSGLPTIHVPQTTDPAAIAKFAADGLTPGQAFPNNKIPSNLIDPNVSLLLGAGIFPAANNGSSYTAAAPNGTVYREETFRIDQEINSKVSLMGSLIYDNGNQTQATPLWSGDTYPTVGSSMMVPSWAGVVHATITMSPTLLNEAAFNFNGNNILVGLNGTWKEPSGYSVKQLSTGNTLNRIPTIGIQGPYNVNYDMGSWPWSNTFRSDQGKDDISWTHGTHNMKFGASYMWTHKNQQIFGNTQGNYTFNGSFTGNSFSDFLLGYASSYSELYAQDFVHITNNTYGLYALDDWHATKRLTLNLGLRWEGLPHAYDTGGRLSNFYPNLYSPTQAAQFLPSGALNPQGPGFTTVSGIPLSNVPFYMNGIGLAGKNGIPQGLVPNQWNTFAPRVGFAFDVTGHEKTIVRGGFGMFYERLGGNEEYTMGPNPPFAFTASTNNVYFSNPATSDTSGLSSSSPVFPANFTGLAPGYKIPTSIQYNIGIQQQLTQNAVLSVAYVGNENYNQSEEFQVNNVPTSDPNRMAICGGNCGYTGPAYNANLDRPYLGWSSIGLMGFGANSNYNSLQVSLRATAWKNLTFSGAYTWSHAFDLLDGELFTNLSNPLNARYDYGSSGFDRRQIAVFTFVYDVPFFRNAASQLTKAMLGGWTISGIALFESGTPQSVTSANDNLGLGGGTTNRASQVAAVTYSPGNINQYFSTSSFAEPGPLQWGTSDKDAVVTPGRNNWNLSLFKAFQVRENTRFELRCEAFNAFNHPQFNGLNTSFGSTRFGQLTGTYDPRVLQVAAKFSF